MTIRDQLLAQKGEERFANRIDEKRISEILRVRLRRKKTRRESSSMWVVINQGDIRAPCRAKSIRNYETQTDYCGNYWLKFNWVAIMKLIENVFAILESTFICDTNIIDSK